MPSDCHIYCVARNVLPIDQPIYRCRVCGWPLADHEKRTRSFVPDGKVYIIDEREILDTRCRESSKEGARCIHQAGHDGWHLSKDAFSYYSWDTPPADSPSERIAVEIAAAYLDVAFDALDRGDISMTGACLRRIAQSLLVVDRWDAVNGVEGGPNALD